MMLSSHGKASLTILASFISSFLTSGVSGSRTGKLAQSLSPALLLGHSFLSQSPYYKGRPVILGSKIEPIKC